MNHGSKKTPILDECRNAYERIAKGKFTTANLTDAGMLGLTAGWAGTPKPSKSLITGIRKLSAA